MKPAIMLSVALMLLAPPLAAREAKSPDYAAAVSAPGRPADDVSLDAGRKPAEVLRFMGLRSGDQVADIMAGTGYYSEIMARAVGPKGHVSAYDPKQFAEGNAKVEAAWTALKARAPNVSYQTYPFEGFAAPANSFDFVMIHLDYHDLYWESARFKVPKTDPAAFLKTLYAAMKPGSTVAIIDHVALPGDARATVDKLHRIDPAVVKADFKAAGFMLDGESDMLRNAADDHTKLVFDPSIRGKTDRFVLRFRKPRRA